MKWYSTGDSNGYTHITVPTIYGTTWTGYAWLLIYYETDTAFTSKGFYVSHGASETVDDSFETCRLYRSYFDANGQLKTEMVKENDQPVEKRFGKPFRGCTDTHTYLKFLTEDTVPGKKSVYFYNPDFPSYDSYE
jgi:hypothetical protein